MRDVLCTRSFCLSQGTDCLVTCRVVSASLIGRVESPSSGYYSPLLCSLMLLSGVAVFLVSGVAWCCLVSPFLVLFCLVNRTVLFLVVSGCRFIIIIFCLFAESLPGVSE